MFSSVDFALRRVKALQWPTGAALPGGQKWIRCLVVATNITEEVPATYTWWDENDIIPFYKDRDILINNITKGNISTQSNLYSAVSQ